MKTIELIDSSSPHGSVWVFDEKRVFSGLGGGGKSQLLEPVGKKTLIAIVLVFLIHGCAGNTEGDRFFANACVI